MSSRPGNYRSSIYAIRLQPRRTTLAGRPISAHSAIGARPTPPPPSLSPLVATPPSRPAATASISLTQVSPLVSFNLTESPPWRPVASKIPKSSELRRSMNHGERLLECPVCFSDAVPPFLQCSNGHIVCNVCLPNLQMCPTCRADKPSIRNLLLEKVAQKFRYACAYSHNGCTERVLMSDKVDHESLCSYKTLSVSCFLTECSWQGNPTEILPHILSHKEIVSLEGPSTIVKLSKVQVAEDLPKLNPSQVCLMAALDCQFLVIVGKFLLLPGECQIGVECVNLSSLKRYKNTEETPVVHKAKFKLTSGNGFKLTWEQPIHANEFRRDTPKLIKIQGETGSSPKDPVLKVTILSSKD